MHVDPTPLIIGILILLSSIISLKIGISVAVIEILLGVIAGNLGLKPEEWMMYLAGFGGIILTFLAGAEMDMTLFREKGKESFLIGFFSFLVPFVIVFFFAYYIAQWTLNASLIAGAAMSTTSIAVVYSVLIETGLSKTQFGKLLLASTFITDITVVLVISILFIKPTVYTLAFVVISIVVVYLATKFSHLVFDHPGLKNKVIEPEIKYIFVLLLVFMYFAGMGASHAVLPAFILGLLMSPHFTETKETKVVRNRLRTVAYAVITPVFFIAGGMKISLTFIASAFLLFSIFFALKLIGKFIGVYFLAKKYIPDGGMYTTLLMSTGLTFGTIVSVFGLESGMIDELEYSLLVGAVVLSAVIPTFIAQKWFTPVHSEDIVETEE